MAAAKGAELSYPGLFARAEVVLLQARKVQLSYVDAHRVAQAYLDKCLTPAGRLAVHTAGYTPEAYSQHVDKMAMSAMTSQIAVSCNYRMTQQVISFDPTVSELLEGDKGSKAALLSDSGEPLPTELLGRLPFETFVIVPNAGSVSSYLVNCIRGWGSSPGQMYLNVVARVLMDDGLVHQIPACAMLDEGRSLVDTIEFTLGLFQQTGVGEVAEVEDYHRQVTSTILASVMPYLLYLCAENREVDGDFDAAPKVAMTKKGERLFARQSPNVLTAGFRIGTAIRQYQGGDDAPVDGAGSGIRHTPHLRKAHWHTFWKGPRLEPAKRQRILHFLPPIPVNVGKPGDLQGVIRPAMQAA
jgi:hypothetical protein